ncbi:MAG TPA: PAS domain-containing protein [Arenibaculum sp.]|nr:PAS domain-containing protein [Arenibaculum sp.]
MHDRASATDDAAELRRRVRELEAENAALLARIGQEHATTSWRGSEQDFRSLADAFPALIAYVDTGERYRFVNLAYEGWLGRPREAFFGKTAREVVGDEAYARRAQYIATALAGHSVRFEQTMPHRDGTTRFTETLYEPKHGPDGAVEGFYLLVTDISERKAAEDALRESEARYRMLFEAMDEGFFLTEVIFDEHDRPVDILYLEANPAATRMTGQDYVGRRRSEISPDYEPYWYEAIGRTARTGQGSRMEMYAGPLKAWFDFYAFKVGGADERRVAVIFKDVTERKRVEEELKRLNATLEEQVAERTRERDRLWDLSEDLLIFADYEGRLRRVSPSWMRLLGHDEAALLAKPYDDVVHPDDRDLVRAKVDELRAGRQAVHFEDRVLAADGSSRWIAWVLAPDPDGRHLHGVGRDITAEKAAAVALEEVEEQFRQAQKMEAVGQMSGGVAHDFNNLLQAMSGNLEMIERRLAAGRTDVGQYAAAMRTTVSRATTLTQRLLAFSRRQPLNPERTDLNALVTGMRDLIQRSVGEAVRVKMVLARELWRIWADANQVESALLNMANNARDAMPDGGQLTIETSNVHRDEAFPAAEPGDYVLLTVTDTGSGMPPDVLARAFEPFFTTKPIGQGTGLGLSQIYGFARQSGGHARIDSQPGRGTSVWLYLPRHRGPDEVEAARSADPEPPRAQPQGQGTVLVVEDELLVRMLLVELLEEQGYTALEAGDGNAALQILATSGPIHLLATDVGLPGLNGRQLAEMARAMRPDLKVLFLTGYAYNAAMEEEVLGPNTQILGKPVAANTFLAKVRTMLESR